MEKSMRTQPLCCLLLCAVLVSCAHVSEYTLAIRYVPQKHVQPVAGRLQNYPITVTSFIDGRTVTNTADIGGKGDGSNAVIARCAQGEPAAAAAGALRDFLIKAGYTVTEELPAWNLEEKSIRKSWGALVIGGRVDAFEVLCDTDQPATRYHAAVTLRLVFADSQREKILHTTTIESTTGLEQFRCTREGMQEQINRALSLAVEKTLDNSELDNALREVGSIRDEILPE
jgi:hypothetical protein